MSPARLALLCLLAAATAGCAAGGAIVLSAADSVSYAHTDRSIVDNAASLVASADCSTMHLRLNQPYCQPVRDETPQAPLYCYRSLGQIDCFHAADPYRTGIPPVN